MLLPVLQTAAAATLLTVAEAKAHLRIDHSDEDSLIETLIAAVTSHLEGPKGILGGRCLINQTWAYSVKDFPNGFMPDWYKLRLPLAPLRSVTSLAYLSAADTSVTVSTDVYAAYEDAESPYLSLKPYQSWPTPYDVDNAITVTFIAGYGAAASDVPEAIRHAAKLMVGDWYEHRETVAVGVSATEIPISATARHLLSPFVRIRP